MRARASQLKLLALAWPLALLTSCQGGDPGPGEIHTTRRSDGEIAFHAQRIAQTGAELRARGEATAEQEPAKQVLFGDLHVHSDYSLDAIFLELPATGLRGGHPPADACDFARYCSKLDFFSITDHAESLTPKHWNDEKRMIRRCNILSGEDGDQDLVAFMGFEWTQVGLSPNEHWGHKNVIFPGIQDEQLPTRPINSRNYGSSLGVFNALRQVTQLRWVDPLHWKRYNDLNWLFDALGAVPECPRDVATQLLPAHCAENAPTPDVLYRKLDEWGFDSLVIPHGGTWGVYTPPLTRADKSLNAKQHSPQRQRLIEVMSGHGNSEEYRRWKIAIETENKLVCPPPSENFLPCCHQAGEIMRKRCLELPKEECEQRVQLAKKSALEAGVSYSRIFPDTEAEDWLDCNQCQDCFKPSYNYVPTESTQYMMALSNFNIMQGLRPMRYRFGFIAATDDHTARPGTGYKQYERRKMTLASGGRSAFYTSLMRPPSRMENRQNPERFIEGSAIALPEMNRMNSYVYPGGILAVHATSRKRQAIWNALKRREVYGTSGPRILLWFDLLNTPQGRTPMGSETQMGANPRFEVRASGSFMQKPGCPADSREALGAKRLDQLCAGECYHPDDMRHPIQAIEIVRIRPQSYPKEPVDGLIDDPWKRFECTPDPAGCVIQFEDEEYRVGNRDTLYYARVLQKPTLAINANQIKAQRDATGTEVTNITTCYGDSRTSFDDDCLSLVSERAWSSPIFVNHPKAISRSP